MPSLNKLMGGAAFVTLSGNYQMGNDPLLGGIAFPRVLSFNGTGTVTLPTESSPYQVTTDGRKFYLVNQSGISTAVYYNTYPLVGGVATLTPVLLGTLLAGNVGTVSLCLDNGGTFLKWYMVQRAFGAVYGTTYKRADNAARVPIPTPAARPAPIAPPPPYLGTGGDFSSCSATFTVTLSGGAGSSAIWNGAWTVTKSATVPYYWRYVIDNNHWVDLRNYPANLYEFAWQVVLIDLTQKARRRFVAANNAATCPPPGLYVQTAVLSENALTTPSMTCSVA